MKGKIVVVGSSNVDLIMKMQRIPEKGETVSGAEFFQVYGGKGANQAVAAARAGGNVTFVSCVGDDAYVPQMIQNYKRDKMDTRYVFEEKNVPSGHALIMIDGKGENCISVAAGANERLRPQKIDMAVAELKAAALIVMQNEIPAETIRHVIDIAHENGVPVLWNFAPAETFDLSCLSKINTLVLNEIEAGYLARMPVENRADAEKAAEVLIGKGVGKVLITLGAKGAFVLHGKEKVSTGAFEVEAVDTTGAGDTFCGSFAVALVEGKPLEEALRFAGAAAAISVTRMGAQPSIPFRDEIDRFLKERI